MVDDEYAFFDSAALAAANQWAGVSHWKHHSNAAASNKLKHSTGDSEVASISNYYYLVVTVYSLVISLRCCTQHLCCVLVWYTDAYTDTDTRLLRCICM
jgi:hypothetical protein